MDIQSDMATYDTQFGVVSRPTHRNTSWDAAKCVSSRFPRPWPGADSFRFEVCGHKFADYSEVISRFVPLCSCHFVLTVNPVRLRRRDP